MKGWTPSSGIPEGLKGYLDQYADMREILIRAKWTFDGAKTLADAAQRSRDYAADLDGLAARGFELRDEIVDDYGFIGRPDDDGPIDPEDGRRRISTMGSRRPAEKQNGRRICIRRPSFETSERRRQELRVRTDAKVDALAGCWL
jgi:hypothetical protein